MCDVDWYATYIQLLTGYDMTNSDKFLVSILEDAEIQHILNETAQETVPDELVHDLHNWVSGSFIRIKKQDILGADNMDVVKTIQEGDVRVDLSGSSPESRLDELVSELMKERDLTCFRKLRW